MRTPVVRFLYPGPGYSGRGLVELWINRLLVEANRDPKHYVHEALSAIANGQPFSIEPDSTMTAMRWITLKNIAVYMRSRARYLRRCPHCNWWFMTSRKRREICLSPTCKRAAAAKRQAAARKREQAAQRRERERVTLNGTRRTK